MTSGNSSIIEIVREFVINNFFVDKNVVFNNCDSFLDKGIIDSTGILEIVGFIEDTFNITIADTEMLPENLDSVINIEQFIEKKTKAI